MTNRRRTLCPLPTAKPRDGEACPPKIGLPPGRSLARPLCRVLASYRVSERARVRIYLAVVCLVVLFLPGLVSLRLMVVLVGVVLCPTVGSQLPSRGSKAQRVAFVSGGGL